MIRTLKRRTLEEYSPISTSWSHHVCRLTTSEDIWGYVWSVATNRKGLIALQDGGKCADGDIDKPSDLKLIRKMLSLESEDKIGVDLADLRLFLGGRKAEKCLRCKSMIRSPTTRRGCIECGDNGEHYPGYADPERELARICGVPVDAQLLQEYLPRALGYGFATIGVDPLLAGAKHKTSKILVIGGTEIVEYHRGVREMVWRVLVCGVNEKDVQGVPPTYHPGIGALWHLRDTPDRGVLSDWCLDHDIDPVVAMGSELENVL